MSFDSYPLRILLAIGVLITSLFVIATVLVQAPNFWLGILFLVPIVPLLRVIGDIANPDVNLVLRPRLLFQHYLAVLLMLVLTFSVLFLMAAVVPIGLAIVAAALAILVGTFGLLLWLLQYGFGLTLGRSLDPNEWQGNLLILGAGIAVAALGFGLLYLGIMIKRRLEGPFWRMFDRLRKQIAEM